MKTKKRIDKLFSRKFRWCCMKSYELKIDDQKEKIVKKLTEVEKWLRKKKSKFL